MFQCSYDVCKKSEKDNRDAVEEYASTWRARGSQIFDCYYNTENMKDAILQKMHTKQDVLHSMLWPSLVIVICGVVFLHLEMKRRQVVCCGKVYCASEDNAESKNSKEMSARTNPDGEYITLDRNGEMPGCSEKHSLLQYKPQASGAHIECTLLKQDSTDRNSPFISSSLSSLDRLVKTVDKSKLCTSNPRIGSCVSADGIRPGVREPPDGSPGHQTRSSLAGSTCSPYYGSHHDSKVQGLETPV